MIPIKAFTDASYSPTYDVAVLGFIIADEDPSQGHYYVLYNMSKNQLTKGCTQAELLAIDHCVAHVRKRTEEDVVIYSDCQKSNKLDIQGLRTHFL